MMCPLRVCLQEHGLAAGAMDLDFDWAECDAKKVAKPKPSPMKCKTKLSPMKCKKKEQVDVKKNRKGGPPVKKPAMKEKSTKTAQVQKAK